MYRYASAACFLITASSVVCAAEFSTPFPATVTTVFEGDIMEAATAGGPVIVRVFGVDSPDEGQPGFESAASFTRALVENAELVFEPKGTDLYDRLVCEVVLPDGRNLSRELARSGWAWRYKAHVRDDLVLTRLTFDAMESKQGLWADNAPLAPWDFRGERPRDEVFFPFTDELAKPVSGVIEPPRTIDLMATDRHVREKSVTIRPDGSRRLVLKGNHKQSAADVAFIRNSNKIMRNAVARRAEEKRANARARQMDVQYEIQAGIEDSEYRQQLSNIGYSIGGTIIISGSHGFPSAIIYPPVLVESTPSVGTTDLWPYVQRH